MKSPDGSAGIWVTQLRFVEEVNIRNNLLPSETCFEILIRYWIFIDLFEGSGPSDGASVSETFVSVRQQQQMKSRPLNCWIPSPGEELLIKYQRTDKQLAPKTPLRQVAS